MDNISFFDTKGNRIMADFVFAINVPQLNKTFVAINNGDLVFDENSSYNNLDILELTNENGNYFYLSDIQEEDWDDVKQALIDELFSKIK